MAVMARTPFSYLGDRSHAMDDIRHNGYPSRSDPDLIRDWTCIDEAYRCTRGTESMGHIKQPREIRALGAQQESSSQSKVFSPPVS